MKIKILISIIVLSTLKIYSMNEPERKKTKLSDSSNTLEIPADLVIGHMTAEFADAWCIASGQEIPSLKAIAAIKIYNSSIAIAENQLPEELTDFIKKIWLMAIQIKNVNLCDISSREKKLLLSLVNNINFDIVEHFFIFLNNFIDRNGENITDKQSALDAILREACKRGDANLARAALCLGADVNSQATNGKTPLMFTLWCYTQDHKEVIELLLQSGADINKQSRHGTALIIAIKRFLRQACPMEVISMFLKAGANPNFTDRQGITALIYAARNAKKELVECLLMAGADPRIEAHGYTALSLVQILKSKENINANVFQELEELLQNTVHF